MLRCIFFILFVNIVYSKPLTSNLSVNVQGVNASTYSRFFEASLLIYAPDSWVSAYRAVPETEVECLLKLTHDPSQFKALQNADDVAVVKKFVANGCPDGADSIGAFLDVISETIAKLPENLLSALAEFGDSAKTFQDAVKEAKSSGQRIGNTTLVTMKDSISTFLTKLSDLSENDKESTADLFPKLKAFIVGKNATKLQTDLVALLSSVGTNLAGARSNPEFKEALTNVKSSAKVVFKDYLAQNQIYLDEAAKVIGRATIDQLKFGQFGAFSYHEQMDSSEEDEEEEAVIIVEPLASDSPLKSFTSVDSDLTTVSPKAKLEGQVSPDVVKAAASIS
ncbi:unnamed protein product [Bursaphelenchus okinawaensis]|uniref:Fatty-acid and retinol-binding protein 1 n=1 Tax=Bursaphelenchus okinawaensis TaxID=465554 RepID=A0A811JS31_9BILA|nr:unnamed protein product [Bursaphelenchus okinawaensis]CAG9079939.1 unnamed protein product [Bursaphelenchus okinawaensis]